MANEKHGQITISGVCVFIKIHKYIVSSPVQSLNNLNCLVVGRRFCLLFILQKSLFRVQKRDALFTV